MGLFQRTDRRRRVLGYAFCLPENTTARRNESVGGKAVLRCARSIYATRHRMGDWIVVCVLIVSRLLGIPWLFSVSDWLRRTFGHRRFVVGGGIGVWSRT